MLGIGVLAYLTTRRQTAFFKNANHQQLTYLDRMWGWGKHKEFVAPPDFAPLSGGGFVGAGS